MMKLYKLILIIPLLITCASMHEKYSYPFDFFDKNSADEYAVNLYKLNESDLNKMQLSALKKIKRIGADSVIIPTQLHYEILYPEDYPFSPPNDIKFILTNSDSLRIYISPVGSSLNITTLVYSDFMSKGYYSLEYNFPVGLYDFRLLVGGKEYRSKLVVIK